MAEGILKFAFELADKISGPSRDMAKNTESLGRQFDSAKKKLEIYEYQLAHAQKISDAGAYVKYGQLVGEAAQKTFDLGEAMEASGRSSEVASKGILASVAALGPYAAAAIAAAVATGGFVAVLGDLIFKGAEFAIESSQMKSELVGVLDAMSDVDGFGERGIKTIDAYAVTIGRSREEVADWAKTFMAMGVTDLGELRSQILTTASATALLGKEGGHAYEEFAAKIQFAIQAHEGLKIAERRLESLRKSGVNLDDVAKRLGTDSHKLTEQLKVGLDPSKVQAFGNALQDSLQEKGAGPLARMAMSLTSTIEDFRTFSRELFEDVNVKPFLDMMHDIVEVFDKSTDTGKAFKLVITEAFTGILGTSEEIGPKIQEFFLDIAIWSVESYIYVKQHWTDITQTLSGLVTVGKYVAYTIGVLIAGALAATAPLWAPIVGGVAALGSLAHLIGGTGKSGEQSGKAISDGMVDGIEAGSPGVAGAAFSLGDEAQDALRANLKVHSPSLVMAGIGEDTGEGFAMGIRSGAKDAGDASEDMGEMALSRTGDGIYPPSGGNGGSSADRTVNGGIHITIQAPQGVTGAAELTEIAIATIFERIQLQQGM